MLRAGLVLTQGRSIVPRARPCAQQWLRFSSNAPKGAAAAPSGAAPRTQVVSAAAGQQSSGGAGGGWGKAVATAAIAVILTAGTYHSLRDVINSYSAPVSKKLVCKEQFVVPTVASPLQGSPQSGSELAQLLEQNGLPENRVILAVGPHGSGKTALIRSCLSEAGSPTLTVEPREYAALYRTVEHEDEAPASHLLALLTSALTPREEAPKRPLAPSAAEAEPAATPAMEEAQKLYESMTDAVAAVAGGHPTVFIDNFGDFVTLAESDEDRQVLESLLCWIMALSKSQGSARVVLASSDPFVLERLPHTVLDADIAQEFNAAVTQVQVGESYSAAAAAAMVDDLSKKYGVAVTEGQQQLLVANLGSSCAPLSIAMRALQAGCTLEQAVDWALAGSLEAANALLQLDQGLLVWELMNVLAKTADKHASASPYVELDEVVAAFKDKNQQKQVVELLRDTRVQQLVFYHRRPTLEMVKGGARAHRPHLAMATATLRAFERLTSDDDVKRRMWEEKRRR